MNNSDLIKPNSEEKEKLETGSRETKRYKAKSRTDTYFTSKELNDELYSLPVEQQAMPDGENATVGIMSIQERMAALKKNGEDEWKRRHSSTETTESALHKPSFNNNNNNIVKQHQLQLKQQLLMTTPKAGTPYQLLKNEQKSRDALATLNETENKVSQSNESLDSLDELPPPEPLRKEKRLSFNRRAGFSAELEKALATKAPPSGRQVSTGGSDTDSMLSRNLYTLGKLPHLNNYEKVELFSTDSEMDSFFKETESLAVGSSCKYNDLFSSSCGSPVKTDENTNNEEVDEDEFDKIVSGAQR